jgi:hypothetical protein
MSNDGMTASDDASSLAAARPRTAIKRLLQAGLWSASAIALFGLFDNTIWRVLCWFWFMDGVLVMAFVVFSEHHKRAAAGGAADVTPTQKSGAQ